MGLELVEEDPKEVRGPPGRVDEECWGGGRDDWSREIRRMERRRDPSPEEVYEEGLLLEEICLEEEVEDPRTRGRDEVEPEADDDDEGKAIPRLDWDRAGEAGRGMWEEEDEEGTGRKVGVVGREDAWVEAERLPSLDDGRFCFDGRV